MPDELPCQPVKSCPQVLDYQDSAIAADIRREIRPDGASFIIPAGPLSADARGICYRESLLSAALFTTCLLVLGSVAVRLSFPLRLEPAEVIVGIFAFTVFAAALFALIWRSLALRKIDARTRLNNQPVAIHANNQRLLIETSRAGASVRIESEDIETIEVGSSWRDRAALPELRVKSRSGQWTTLVSGRDATELNHIASTLRWALQGDPRRDP